MDVKEEEWKKKRCLIKNANASRIKQEKMDNEEY